MLERLRRLAVLLRCVIRKTQEGNDDHGYQRSECSHGLALRGIDRCPVVRSVALAFHTLRSHSSDDRPRDPAEGAEQADGQQARQLHALDSGVLVVHLFVIVSLQCRVIRGHHTNARQTTSQLGCSSFGQLLALAAEKGSRNR